MNKPRRIAQTPREHFMNAADEEFYKFELKERAFRQAERVERAAKLGLPLALAEQSNRRSHQTEQA